MRSLACARELNMIIIIKAAEVLRQTRNQRAVAVRVVEKLKHWRRDELEVLRHGKKRCKKKRMMRTRRRAAGFFTFFWQLDEQNFGYFFWLGYVRWNVWILKCARIEASSFVARSAHSRRIEVWPIPRGDAFVDFPLAARRVFAAERLNFALTHSCGGISAANLGENALETFDFVLVRLQFAAWSANGGRAYLRKPTYKRAPHNLKNVEPIWRRRTCGS